jgi:signal transduction histidine kinase
VAEALPLGVESPDGRGRPPAPKTAGEEHHGAGHQRMTITRPGSLRRATDPVVVGWVVRGLGVAALVSIVAWVARSESAARRDADALPLVVALAVMSVAWLVFLLPSRLDRRLQLTSLLVVGLCAATLNHLRPVSPAFLAALLAMAGAAARLPVGPAVGVMAVVAAAITVSEGAGATHTIPAGVSYTLAAAALFGVAAYVRALREAHRRAERIVVELRATRRAEARAAALAERARLAREMHDILAHVLSALSLQLEATALMLEEEGAPPRALQQVHRAQRLAHDGLHEAQQAIGALRGDRLPGPELLAELVDNFSQATGVAARLVVEGEPRPLAREAGLAVYRTAQEALTNVRKHAKGADEVAVVLRWQGNELSLTVQDRYAAEPGGPTGQAGEATRAGAPAADGQSPDRHGRDGQSPDGAGPGGYGLTGMRERAELLGGELVAGGTADGFQVRLWLPA